MGLSAVVFVILAVQVIQISPFHMPASRPVHARQTLNVDMAQSALEARKSDEALQAEYTTVFNGFVRHDLPTITELVHVYSRGKLLVAQLAAEIPRENSTYLPPRHAAALSALNVTMKFLYNVLPDYYSVLRVIPGKKKLNSLYARMDREGNIVLNTARENLQARRCIERSYAEVWDILFTLAIASESERKDLLYFLRPIVETVSPRDRFFVRHLLLRGFFFPAYLTPYSGYKGNAPSVASYYLGNMRAVFANTLFGFLGKQPPQTFKAAYPFLLVPLACARAGTDMPAGNAENDVCRLLCNLQEIDPSLPMSLQQWVVDTLYDHFDRRFRQLIAKGSLNPRLELAVSRGTVARDLLMCSLAMDIGAKLDRTQFVTALTEVGRCLEVLLAQTVLNKQIQLSNDPASEERFNISESLTQFRTASKILLQQGIQHPIRMRLRKALGLYASPSLLPTINYTKFSDNYQSDFDFIGAPNRIQSLLVEFLSKVTSSTSEQLHKPHVQARISQICKEWRCPYLLMEYYSQHQREPDVLRAYQRYLQALFGISGETVDDIRFRDPRNEAHLSAFPLAVRNMWESGKGLPGYADPETLFMVGEDSLSCLAIRSEVKRENKALLSYIMQGNVRVLGVKEEGQLVAQAIVRLLVDKETKRPCIYVEHVYAVGGNTDPKLTQAVYDQATELSEKLGLPIVRASTESVEGNKIERLVNIITLREEIEVAWSELMPGLVQSFKRLYPEMNETDIRRDLQLPHPAIKPDCNIKQASQLVELDGVAPYVWVEGLEVFPGQFAANIEQGPVRRSIDVREVAVCATYTQV